MRKLPVLAAVLNAILLVGCVEANSTDPPLVVNVRSLGDECRVTVIRNAFAQPLEFTRANQAQLLQIARQAKNRRGIVVSDVNAQYKCIGAVIITLQQAGLSVDMALWDSR